MHNNIFKERSTGSTIHLLNNGRRPADLWVPFLDAGRPVAIDFTCVSQLRGDFLKREADYPVKFAHERKERAVGAELRREGISFRPVAVSTFGNEDIVLSAPEREQFNVHKQICGIL